MKALFLLILLSLASGLQAQLKGVLKFTSDSSAVPFSNVYIKGTTKGTVSNAEGHFALRYSKSARHGCPLLSSVPKTSP